MPKKSKANDQVYVTKVKYHTTSRHSHMTECKVVNHLNKFLGSLLCVFGFLGKGDSISYTLASQTAQNDSLRRDEEIRVEKGLFQIWQSLPPNP